jgi:hypothetical protein
LTDNLKQYYPQALDWFEQRDTVLFCDFLGRWPTLTQVKRARQTSVKDFFHAHNGRRPQVINARLDAIKAANSLTDVPGVIMPCKLRTLVLVEQLRVTLEGIDRYDREIVGITPVIERSGKKHWVHWRLQCPTFLRQTFIEWVGQTINKSYWACAYYRQQRDKDISHSAAVRALAFKWIRILYRCWKTRTPYDETKYLIALKNRGSPLLKNLSLN